MNSFSILQSAAKVSDFAIYHQSSIDRRSGSQPKVSTEMTLDTINVLVVRSADYETLALLLALCPNVKQIRFTLAFGTDENLSQLNDARIQDTCRRIETIKLVPTDHMTEQDIQKLFPNASVTYDAIPYRTRMFKKNRSFSDVD